MLLWCNQLKEIGRFKIPVRWLLLGLEKLAEYQWMNQIDGLVQDCLISMLIHWRYCSLALSHRCEVMKCYYNQNRIIYHDHISRDITYNTINCMQTIFKTDCLSPIKFCFCQASILEVPWRHPRFIIDMMPIWSWQQWPKQGHSLFGSILYSGPSC